MNRIEQAIVDLNTTLTSMQSSLSKIIVASSVSSVIFLDVNSRDCPGYTIETQDGRKVGIYAQEGLGFVLYDYTAQKRLGLCSFG